MKLSELFTEVGEPFSYYPGFVHTFAITTNASVLLCFIGWKTFSDEMDGWKSFTTEAIERATGLSVKEQATARRQLVEANLIEEYYARLEHTLKFRLTKAEIGVSPNAETAYAQTPNQPVAKPQNGVSTKGQVKGIKEGEEKPAVGPATVSPKALPEEIEFWNRNEKLTKVVSVSPGRAKTLAARRKDPFFVASWKRAIEKVAASSFCRGQNDRGWKADIDFFLRPDSVAKIMEGKYDDKKAYSKPGNF